MGPTLQLDLTAVRNIAARVSGAAAAIAGVGYRLRISPGSPAADTTTLALSRRLDAWSLQLAYAAEDAADELMRANEAILEYAYNAAALARRTELAIMGLDVAELTPYFGISASREPRPVERAGGVPPPALDGDHRALGEAVLLSAGRDRPAYTAVEPAHLRAAASTLHHCARDLRAAIANGERPAGTVDRFGSWLDDDYIPGVLLLADNRKRWAAAYSFTREQVHQPAGVYRSWLSVAAAGGDNELPCVRELAEQVRAPLRDYALTPFGQAACAPHPRLGARTQ
ncbi:hypothetical protein [Mycobacterium avium]|uniref:Uncharacterized protein n=1 Tax=Mycobacterium avium subsp. hominissuis TaxID=439334 RepID=A0AAI8STF1_MYCAV|nr:hypothetical protein [Mycobacterium avium]PBA08446.1 hypothetical protein CKJ70_26350 [Mycobacterium avium]BBN50931.1 hypothetical protein JPH1_54060 [Mycobacterium avium subsp. hominissuis]